MPETTDTHGDALYYCDLCGARYSGPGTCSNGHAPEQVKPLDPSAAAETGQDEPATPAPANVVGVGEGSDAAAVPADTETDTAAASPDTSSTTDTAAAAAHSDGPGSTGEQAPAPASPATITASIVIGDVTYIGTLTLVPGPAA